MYNIYYNRLGTTWHYNYCIFSSMKKVQGNFLNNFNIFKIILQMLRGVFEMAFRLVHLPANLSFQLLSMKFSRHIFI